MKINSYLRYMADKGASDLFLTTAAPPSIKLMGEVLPLSDTPLKPGVVNSVAKELMNDEQQADFDANLEMNLALSISGVGRFRVNIYRQRGEASIVVRYINSHIPSLQDSNLPPILKDLIANKTGLVLVVGATGSGKSTTLASMLEHRNGIQSGHILTIEDPIEFTFSHKKSIVGQREVGIDTLSYANALREAMREAPDVLMIGEIRDRETMEAAMTLSDTGHLVVSTLHAINANQAFDRIVNLFPADERSRVLQDLSLNLRGIVSQRLLKTTEGKRVPAVEVLINTPFIADLIGRGKVSEMKEVMEKSSSAGMQTFDQSLLALFEVGQITRDDALEYADSPNNLKWQMNFGGDITGEHPALTTLQDLDRQKVLQGKEGATGQDTAAKKPGWGELGDLAPFSKSKLTE